MAAGERPARAARHSSRCFRCCGCCRCRSCSPAKRARCRRRCCRRARRSPTIANCSSARAWAAILPTASWSRPRSRCYRCVFNLAAGYAFAKLRFAGRDRVFQTMLGGVGHPGAGRDDSAVPDHEMAASRQQLRRRDRAGDGDRVRHLPRAPIRALDSRRIARSRAHRRRRRMAHLRDDRACRC